MYGEEKYHLRLEIEIAPIPEEEFSFHASVVHSSSGSSLAAHCLLKEAAAVEFLSGEVIRISIGWLFDQQKIEAQAMRKQIPFPPNELIRLHFIVV